MLSTPGMFPYSAIAARSPFTWPGGRRLAVYFALCVEHFPYGNGLGLAYSPGLSHPNSYNWGWREYGNRVGGWRLLDLFDEYHLPLTILLNTACYDHCPDLVAAARARRRNRRSWTHEWRASERHDDRDRTRADH